MVKEFEKKLKILYLNLYQPLKDCQQRNQKLLMFVKNIQQQNLTKKRLENLQSLAKNFFDQYILAASHFYVPFHIEAALEKSIKKDLLERLKKINQPDKLENYYLTLSINPREPRVIKARRELLKISLKIARNKNLKSLFLTRPKREIIKKIKGQKVFQEIEQYRKKYIWLPTFLFNVKELTIEQILDNIKESLEKNPGQELKNIQKQKAENRKLYIQAIKRLSIKGRLSKYIWLLREWVYYRQERMAEWAEINLRAKALFDEIARRWNMDYQDLSYLSTDEIISGKFRRQDIKIRQAGYAFELINGHPKYYTGQQLKAYVKKELAELEEKEVNQLKGQAVYPGKVTGRVRVCTIYIFRTLKKGEVLVAGTTTPEAVPYLKKAAAIVTDEGGVLSHAAIVSRELRIPCIIGTKIATRVLKDGMMVEVDANKGVVKILKQ